MHAPGVFYRPLQNIINSVSPVQQNCGMRFIFMFLAATISATAHINEQIQDHFDAIRACSVNYHCTDDSVPDQCLYGKSRFPLGSRNCVKRSQAKCQGSSCSRKALNLKVSDFEAILAKFNVALLANKSLEKKRHELYYPGHRGTIDIGLCAGSCRGPNR